MSNRNYVFAVCGESKYLRQCEDAVMRLGNFSSLPIYIITDVKRNDSKITAEAKIIEVETPGDLNHHQASIYLKTSLPHFLPVQTSSYCYLDSDVFAVSDKADTIFDCEHEGIGFAQDLYTVNEFSAYVFNDGFLEKRLAENQEVVSLISKLEALHHHFKEKQQSPEGKKLEAFLSTVKKDPFRNLLPLSNYLFARAFKFEKQKIRDDLYYKSAAKAWVDKNENEILFDYPSRINKLLSSSPYKFDKKKGSWLNPKGEKVFSMKHPKLREWLTQQTNRQFSGEERLLNGGVFVFDQRAIPFFNTWHDEVMKQLPDNSFRNRDQAALFLAAQKYPGLIGKPLDSCYNFLVDEQHPKFYFHAKKGVGGYGTHWRKPIFMHFISGTENDQNPALQFANNSVKN